MAILEDILSALGPSEAEGATMPRASTTLSNQMALKNMGFQQQAELQNQRIQSALQQAQLRLQAQQQMQQQQIQQRQQMEQQKTQGKKDTQAEKTAPLADLTQSLQGEAPIMRGTNVATGNPVFSNIPEQTQASPQFTKGIKWEPKPYIPGTAPAGGPTGAPGAPGVDQFMKRAQMAAALKASGVPEKEIERALDAMMPGTKAPGKPLTPTESSKMFYYDPKKDTIEPLASLGEEATPAKAKELGARELGAGELTGMSALNTVDTAFQDFQSAATALAKVSPGVRTTAAAIGGTNPLNTRAFIAADKLTNGAWSQYHSARLELAAILAHLYGLGTRGASSPQLETMLSSGLGTILDQPGKLPDRFSTLQKRIDGLKRAAKIGAFGTGKMPSPAELMAPGDSGSANRLEAARQLLKQGVDLNAQVGGQY